MLRLFSNSLPNNRIVYIGLLIIAIALLLNPWLFGGSKALLIAAKICIFIVLVASYDLLIGYTGIISFAHTVFFAMGAYGIGMSISFYGPHWWSMGLGALSALCISAVVALCLGLVSFRVKRIFFAMITLAIASAFAIFLNQNYTVTGGEDGLSFRLPHILTPANEFISGKLGGARIDGKLLSFYFIYALSFICVFLMLRITQSPFGRVLTAIRENEFRSNALGYTSNVYVIGILIISSCFATIAGMMLAMANRYVNTETTASMQIMIDILLMVVLGGMGTIYGAIFGVTLVILAQNYLQALLSLATGATTDTPLSAFFEHERWLFWLGVIFIISVYFFPQGIAGSLQKLQTRVGKKHND